MMASVGCFFSGFLAELVFLIAGFCSVYMAKIQINWQLLRDLCSKVSQISRQAIMACFKLRESAVIVRKLGVEIVPGRAGGTACAQVAEATGESWILSILLIKIILGFRLQN